jgi:hypothetical protein
MISLFNRRYFADGPQKSEGADAQCAVLSLVLARMVEDLGKHVITGDVSEQVRREFEAGKEAFLHAETPEALIAAEEAIGLTLAQHRAESLRTTATQAVEVQHILATLNRALIAISEGRDRSVSRLTEIQGRLQRASMLRDIVALKTALTDTARFVERENSEVRQVVDGELARLQTDTGRARDAFGQPTRRVASRSDAMERLRTIIRAPERRAVYGVVIACSRLDAIMQRYGAHVGEELVRRVIEERLQPIAPGECPYRWSSSAFVLLFESPQTLAAVQASVTALSRGPVLHRAPVGNRVAVLTISPASLVLECKPGEAEGVIEQLDAFVGKHT